MAMIVSTGVLAPEHVYQAVRQVADYFRDKRDWLNTDDINQQLEVLEDWLLEIQIGASKVVTIHEEAGLTVEEFLRASDPERGTMLGDSSGPVVLVKGECDDDDIADLCAEH